MMLKARVEDHHVLLMQVRKLHRVIYTYSSRVLLQYKDKLSSLSLDTLRDIICEILSIAGDKDR